MPENSVQIKCRYKDSEQTRSYKMNGVEDSVLANVGTKIEAINASLLGGTAGSLSATFISDDFDQTEGVGYLEKIEEAVITSVVETRIWGS